jgi:hypothetical protein
MSTTQTTDGISPKNYGFIVSLQRIISAYPLACPGTATEERILYCGVTPGNLEFISGCAQKDLSNALDEHWEGAA